MLDSKNKLINSVYFEYLVQAVKNGKEAGDIWRELNNEKGYSVSFPTVRAAVKYVKKYGEKATELLASSKQQISNISEEIREIAPLLTNTLKRRTVLLKEILLRKEEVLRAQKEGNRVQQLRKLLEELRTIYLETDDASIIERQIKDIDTFVVNNFASKMMSTNTESLIRQYIMDTHEIFKYCENWTSKYDIYNLIEKVVTKVAEASMLVFGNMIKKETPERKEYIVNKFKKEVEEILKQVEEEELKIGEKENYDEKKYN